MSQPITHGLNALALFALAFLILLQTDEYGELLVNGYHGLGAVCFALFAASFITAQRALRAI